jgi:hypothetical protein
MARQLIGRTLNLVFENGTNSAGNLKYVQKSLRHIADGLSDDALYTLGNELSKVYPLTLSKICVDEDSVIESI